MADLPTLFTRLAGRRVSTVAVAMLTLSLSAGCNGGDELQSASAEIPGMQSTPAERSAQQERNRLEISPEAGAPGSEVRVRIDGLAGNATYAVGFGELRSGYQVLAEVQSDAEGVLEHTVRVPEDLESGEPHYFFLLDQSQQRPLAVSEPFEVRLP